MQLSSQRDIGIIEKCVCLTAELHALLRIWHADKSQKKMHIQTFASPAFGSALARFSIEVALKT